MSRFESSVVSRCVRGMAAIGLCALAFLPSGQAGADDWNARGVRIIVPVAPGGGQDTQVRAIQPYFAKALGVPVIVENIPGGQMAVGVTVASKRAPDCTTLLYSPMPLLMILEMTQPDATFKYDDFFPVAAHGAEPYAILVRNDAPWKTFADFIKDVKANPPKHFRIGSVSYADTNIVQLIEMEEQLGVNFNIVLYPGGAQGRQSLVSGETHFAYTVLFAAQPIRSQTRVIGYWVDKTVQSEAQLKHLMDGSTPIEEQVNVKLKAAGTVYAVFVPKGCRATHPDRYQTLVNAFVKAANDPEYLDKMKTAGLLESLAVMPGDKYDEIARAQRPDLTGLVERIVKPAMAGRR